VGGNHVSLAVESVLRFARSEELVRAEAALCSELKASDASPFLGQHDLSERASAIIRGSLLGPDPVAVFDRLFEIFPAVTVSYLAGLAQRETGRDGEGEFYPHLEEDIDHHLSNAERDRLHTLFRAACLRLGLPVLTRLEQKAAGTQYRIADYELQAGALTSLLPVLAQACVDVERERGPLDPFDPDGARSWQAGVIELLNERGRRGHARVLDADELAWHAKAFARLSAGDQPVTSFEGRFGVAIDKAREVVSYEHSRFGPPTSLTFNNDEILLVAPSQATGWRWAVEGSWPGEVDLRAGEELPVTTETVLRVTALREAVDDVVKPNVRLVTVWGDLRLAIYETRSGKRVGRDAPAGALDLVSRERFVVDGSRSEQTLSTLWKKQLVLEDGQTSRAVFADGRTVDVVAHARSQLDWASASDVDLDGRPTFGDAPDVAVSLSLESATGWGRDLDVLLRTPTRLLARSVVTFADHVHGKASFADIDLGGEFDRLTATLVRRGEDRPLVAAPSAWLWPRLQKLVDGAFVGPIPDNFDQGASVAVLARPGGIFSVLESTLAPELVFRRADGGRYRIRLRRAGISLELQEGADRRSLPIGSAVIDDGAPRFLRVFCDDADATLALPHSEQPRAFASAPMRQVRLDTLSDVGEGEVRLWPSGDRLREVVLATVTRPCAPVYARSSRRGGRPCLEFELAEPVGVFELAGTDLLSGAKTTLATGDGLLIDHQGGRWQVQPDIRAVDDGAWLLEVRAVLRGRERARPLREPRGDRFALLLIKQDGMASTAVDILKLVTGRTHQREVFRRVNQTLAACWAESCWAEDLIHLGTLWRTLGLQLGGAEDAASQDVLLAATGDAPPMDANPSWVPLRHPIEVWPAIYATDMERLGRVLEEADDEGARALSALLRTPAGDEHERHLRHDEACRRFALRVERTARAGMNSNRLSHAAVLCSLSEREARRAQRDSHIPAVPADESEQAAIVDTAPAFFSDLALASAIERIAPNTVSGWIEGLSNGQGLGAHPPLSTVGFLCRLGPELLAWHLQDARSRHS
jgi:hypothetical protein